MAATPERSEDSLGILIRVAGTGYRSFTWLSTFTSVLNERLWRLCHVAASVQSTGVTGRVIPLIDQSMFRLLSSVTESCHTEWDSYSGGMTDCVRPAKDMSDCHVSGSGLG
ncbi:MAG: hypothetical protein JWM11_3442 [Planctomycetaceae bacterium]|nr:hypothetical protein [Planctomycetaceae bacterium]